MSGEAKRADGCPIIDEFIGQGDHPAESSSQTIDTGTMGCAIITEFVGQGAATGGRQPPQQWPLLPSSASEGCTEITVFSDRGFIPASEEKKGAEEQSVQ